MYFLLQEKDGKGRLESIPEEMLDKEKKEMLVEPEQIHGCKVCKCDFGLQAVVQVPLQKRCYEAAKRKEVPLLGQGHNFDRFAFLVMEDGVLFADYDGRVEKTWRKLTPADEEKTPTQMLYRFFQVLVEDDSQLLDIIYKQLATLEEEIPRDNARFFLQKMYTMKQTIYELFRYYHQLTELAEDLMEWECRFLDDEELQKFENFITRTTRLADDMEIMREYAMEIWEIYQSQINIRQNDIMKVLTIVTTIFLPLSLLAGWYGMNFEYMPELSWKYGYLMVILAGVCIVAFLLYFFRKKKYW